MDDNSSEPNMKNKQTHTHIATMIAMIVLITIPAVHMI